MIKYFRIGKIISTQGLKGECKVYPTTYDLKRFEKLKNCFLINENHDIEKDFDKSIEVEIQNVKYVSKFISLKFKDIDDIEDIKKYIGFEIYIDRKFSEKTKENEYYISDLINLNVINNKEKVIGKVIDVEETKVNSNLVIENGKDKSYLPFVKDYILKVDLDKNEILINEEGLIKI